MTIQRIKLVSVAAMTIGLAACSKEGTLRVTQHEGRVEFAIYRSNLLGFGERKVELTCVRTVRVKDQSSGNVVWSEFMTPGKACVTRSALMFGERLPGYDGKISGKLVVGRRYSVVIGATPTSAEGEFVYQEM